MNIKNKKILIVEDNDIIRSELIDILNIEEAITINAKDGEEGILKSRDSLPDLIISDILMPNVDGISMIKEIKKDTTTKNIPIIFLTALSDKEYIEKCISLGIDDYLVKPISVNELIKAVKINLRKKEKSEKEMDNLRSNILKSLPHELRTPLNSILGLSSIMMHNSNNYNEDKFKEYSKYINESGKRL